MLRKKWIDEDLKLRGERAIITRFGLVADVKVRPRLARFAVIVLKSYRACFFSMKASPWIQTI
jgi:hypothetical protein